MASTSLALNLSAVRTSRPGLCVLLMMATDLTVVGLSLTAAVLARHAFDGRYDPALYWRLAGMLALFAAGYAWFGLYPGIATHAVREIRQLTLATTLVFAGLGTLSFLFKEGQTYSRLVFLVGWLLALVLVPLARHQVRSLVLAKSWWGYPVAIFGSGTAALAIVNGLRERPELGMHPVAVFKDESQASHPAFASSLDLGLPVFPGFHSAPLHARRLGLKHAIIAASDGPGVDIMRMLESNAGMFSHVYVVPGLDGFSSFGIETRDVCGMFTFEMKRSLLSPSCQFAKRLMDQCVCLALGAALLPLMLLIAFMIRMESAGRAFYGHKRIGVGGRWFKMWKFRTMYSDGNRILDDYLRENPSERAEWLANQKLRNDPRVTRLGKILRKTSLDELPQLWNVLRGEMSLVGPRPIVNNEVPKYGEAFDLYCRVMPGVTGLWQVSGRSNTTYERRVELDAYYVRNWSPWFDIYLLARTVRTVAKGEGAY